jgi:peptidoglycan hydrolase CwlO-like protein
MSEQILKEILSELREVKTELKEFKQETKERLTSLETGQKKLEGKIDKLTEREENHFNQVLNEIQYTYEGMDKRITPLETKV